MKFTSCLAVIAAAIVAATILSGQTVHAGCPAGQEPCISVGCPSPCMVPCYDPFDLGKCVIPPTPPKALHKLKTAGVVNPEGMLEPTNSAVLPTKAKPKDRTENKNENSHNVFQMVGEGLEVLWRSIRDDEDPMAIAPKDPKAGYNPSEHVAEGSKLKTQWVSFTKDMKIACQWAADYSVRYVKFDGACVEKQCKYVLDCTVDPTYSKLSGTAKWFATQSQEVIATGCTNSVIAKCATAVYTKDDATKCLAQ